MKSSSSTSTIELDLFLVSCKRKGINEETESIKTETQWEDYHVGTTTINRSSKPMSCSNLSLVSTHYLKNWITEHVNHPYPTKEEKLHIMVDTGMKSKQFMNCLRSITIGIHVLLLFHPNPTIQLILTPSL